MTCLRQFSAGAFGGAFGGVIVAILTWFRTERTERVKRLVDFRTEQLTSLYGPVFFLASVNKQIADQWSNLDNAQRESYLEPTFSRQDATQENVSRESGMTTDVKNEYSRRIDGNNKKMFRIIRDNYSVVDIDDAEEFQRFAISVVRQSVEFSDEGSKLPLTIHGQIPRNTTYDEAFVEFTARRFQEKSELLARLQVSRLERIQRWWRSRKV